MTVMTVLAKFFVRLALYCVVHPDVIKELADAIHAAKQPPQPKPA